MELRQPNENKQIKWERGIGSSREQILCFPPEFPVVKYRQMLKEVELKEHIETSGK